MSEQDSSQCAPWNWPALDRDQILVSDAGLARRSRTKVGARLYRVHQRPGIVEFLSAIQTDLIGALVDREHTAPLAVAASKGKAEKR
jgi:hypothetical protein